jgi:hypothetical protein
MARDDVFSGENPYERELLIRELGRTPSRRTQTAGVAPAAASGIQAPPTEPAAPMQSFAEGAGSVAGQMAQDAGAPAQKSTSPFESENQDWRGYMKEATRAYAPTLQGIKDEGEREKAVEDYIRSLIPEVEKRGGKINDVRKEKIQTPDGRWIDLYRDITDGTGSGAAEAQWLEEDPNAPQQGAPMGMPGGGGPSSFQGIQSLMPTDTNFYNTLQSRLAQILGGPEALERDALLQQLQGR